MTVDLAWLSRHPTPLEVVRALITDEILDFLVSDTQETVLRRLSRGEIAPSRKAQVKKITRESLLCSLFMRLDMAYKEFRTLDHAFAKASHCLH